jgi:transcriptional regulator with GAF, ATPase, and Fis domain
MIPPALRQFVLYFKPEYSFPVALLLEHYSFEVKRLSSLDDAIAIIRAMQTCDLYLLIRDLPVGEDVKGSSPDMSLHDVVAALERSMITEALLKHNGNISRAARELKLTRRGLQLKLKRLSMKRICVEDTRQAFNPPD